MSEAHSTIRAVLYARKSNNIVADSPQRQLSALQAYQGVKSHVALGEPYVDSGIWQLLPFLAKHHLLEQEGK
jgi:hypothetical protein